MEKRKAQKKELTLLLLQDCACEKLASKEQRRRVGF